MPSIDHDAGASTISSSISLVKTIIGAGLLSMPLAYSTDGILFGTFIILLAAFTSGFGLFLQCYVSRYVPVKHATFFNLCSITYPHLSVVFDFAIAVQCFGCAVSYLVLIRDLMPTIVTYVPYIDEKHYPSFWLLVSTVLTIPLSFLKNLDSLKYSSILGLVAIFYMSILVIGHYFAGDIERQGQITLFPTSVTGVFSTFSIIVFAFTGHQNMFSIINEARDKSLTSLTKLVNFAIGISSLLFIVVGLSGYLTFGQDVDGNVILSYPNGPTTTIGRFCIVFMVTFSFPLMIHPARISINNIYHWITTTYFDKEDVNESTSLLRNDSETRQIAEDEEQGKTHLSHVVPFPHRNFVIVTTSLLIIGYFLAISIKSFALILAIVGASGSTSISFILPGLFGYKLIGSESDDPSTLEIAFKNLSLGLTFWGVAVMILCLYSSLTL
ncbi:vacuolar amino acid transporter, putative [Candida dubliniensis CD36]|uniref:Vacuolar amino acid transporter, putative n=1 Tax=Candida dubliniensis (strain CD36 / ATCC MYA-646 / CBS 7987 / NCPF 3949 / NRRL Y-17841) TaxID=573826 RepID=B9WB08_CANDC|nr:vacuolar amino acid transporter, putative [Candida dubliniensis CD36]CAX43578.1 vacuolar amino acid transporter, putative [Candida dubliniensis CD36]